MNGRDFTGDDFELLLLRIVDGEASEADMATAADAIAASTELRKRAFVFLCDESLLADEIDNAQRVSKLIEAASSPRERRLAGRQQVEEPPSRRLTEGGILSYVNRHGLAIAAAAALLIAGLIAHNVNMMSKVARLHELTVQNETQAEVQVVVDDAATADRRAKKRIGGAGIGRVIGLDDVRWPEEASELTYGDTVEEGRLVHLAGGVLEILLANGAKVTAAGPVEFELTSLLAMDLQRGKIVASVPRNARGYTIVTPTSELVDIGTQFGVAVSDSGDTELHVFDGDVVARSRVKAASTDLVHAKENEAIRFSAATTELERFAARESGFVRRLTPQVASSELPPLPRVEGLCLWYSADMIRDIAVGEPLPVWRDILVGDNRFANDARQFDDRRCPKLVNDGLGRRAVRFDGGATSLQIDPMDNSGCSTVFVAFAPGPTSFSNDHHGDILFKYGMAPSLELSLQQDRTLRSWVWPGPNENNVASVRSPSIEGRRISVVACQYDSLQSRCQLWLNGAPCAEVDAPVELRQCDASYLGSHGELQNNAFFFGSLYEVIVYDGEFDIQSLGAVSSYLLDRYETASSN
ncbi:MAG: hypothetical protein CMJ58_24810 [Planctomycetaceae bacterium]|nr:hypothetical protein [Planctomycetaceae bacterium]